MAHFEFGGAAGNGAQGGGGFAGFGGSQQQSIFAQQQQQQQQQQSMHVPPPQGQVPRHAASAAQNVDYAAAHGGRAPPSGTPSSYGNFIPKRGRVGSLSNNNGGGADRMSGLSGAGVTSGGGGGSVGSVGSMGRLSSSLSGRLRSVSDLERMGLVNLTQKGRLKDLIINGDESLRIALEKYEAGDLTELEQLIHQGHLSKSTGTSVGSFDALDLDALDLGPLGTDFLGSLAGSLGSLQGTGELARAASDDTARSRTSSVTGEGGRGGHSQNAAAAQSQWGEWDNAVGGGSGGVEFEMDDLGEDLGVLEGYPVMRRPYEIFPPSSQQHAAHQQHQGGAHGGPHHPGNMSNMHVAGGNMQQHHNGMQMHHGNAVGGHGGASNPSSAMAAAAAAAASSSSAANVGMAPQHPMHAGMAPNGSMQGGGGGGNNSGASSHGTRRSTTTGGSSKGGGSSKSGGGGGGGGGGNGSRRAGGGGSQQPTITSQGTVNFPNSINTGSKYPVSNSVAELPALATLPPGQAPAYEALINFQRAKSKDAVRCVMCGKAPTDGDSGTVIPQQNKDVCRDCDKALWVHGESRTYFKWCKGCKRFRNIVAFSEKLDASKCNGCRERGRRSYLQRKGVPGDDPTSAAGKGGGGGNSNGGNASAPAGFVAGGGVQYAPSGAAYVNQQAPPQYAQQQQQQQQPPLQPPPQQQQQQMLAAQQQQPPQQQQMQGGMFS